MATIVDKVPERTYKNKKSKFDKYLDGNIWRVVHGADFRTSVLSFQNGCRQRAYHRGLKVSINIFQESIGNAIRPVLYVEAQKNANKLTSGQEIKDGLQA